MSSRRRGEERPDVDGLGGRLHGIEELRERHPVPRQPGLHRRRRGWPRRGSSRASPARAARAAWARTRSRSCRSRRASRRASPRGCSTGPRTAGRRSACGGRRSRAPRPCPTASSTWSASAGSSRPMRATLPSLTADVGDAPRHPGPVDDEAVADDEVVHGTPPGSAAGRGRQCTGTFRVALPTMTAMSRLSVVPLDAPMGALVSGWEPAAPLADGDRQLLVDALHRSRLLVLRGHPVPGNDELTAFAASFGEVAPAADLYGLVHDSPKVLKVSNGSTTAATRSGRPGAGRSRGTPTTPSWTGRPRRRSWRRTSCRRAAVRRRASATCTPRWRRCRPGLPPTASTAWSAGTPSWPPATTARATPTPTDREARASARSTPTSTTPTTGGGIPHPVVARHPETGREALYVELVRRPLRRRRPTTRAGRSSTTCSARAVAPERTYAHDWQVGDLVVFDTIGTVHARGHVKAAERRTMRRCRTVVDEGWEPPAGSGDG